MVVVALFCLGLLGQEKPPAPAPEPLQIRFLHETACDALEAGKDCRKERHWKFGVGERVLNSFPDLSEVLGKEVDAERAGAPRPELSERVVLLGGHRSVPWGLVVWTMRHCALVGIYKIAWLKAGSEKGELAHKFWLRDPEQGPEICRLADPGITLRWDPALGLSRRVGHQKPSGTLDELMGTLREEIVALKKAGKTEFPVLIDAGEDVLWKDVFEVMDRCRSEGFDRLELVLVPVLRRKAAEKK